MALSGPPRGSSHTALYAAKGGDNKVRMSIREHLLKVASSSDSPFTQKDCQIVEVPKAQIVEVTHKGDAQEVDVPTSAVLKAKIAEATHKGDAQEVEVPSSEVLQAYLKVQSSA